MSYEPTAAVSSYHILVIDDSEADRFLVNAALENDINYHFEVDEFSSFHQLRLKLGTHDNQLIDAVLIDFSVDERPNEKLINELCNILPNTPIIALIHNSNPENTHELAQLGVMNCINKRELSSENTLSILIHSITFYNTIKNNLIKANCDALTGLANRNKLEDRVSHALSLLKRSDKSIALLLIDMDDFKTINDNYGHDVGDIFLQSIARRLQDSVRTSDTVARIGGDEFAILMEGIQHPEISVQLAKKIINNVNADLTIHGKKIKPSLSIGLSMLYEKNKDRFSFDWLFQSADTALYEAKRRGKNTFSVFTDKDDAVMIHNLKMEDELVRAIQDKDFRLYYQPIFHVRTDTICGAEALLRWKNKQGDIICPDQFLGVVEKLGLMKELGDFVIDEALTQYARWQVLNPDFNQTFTIHINIAAAQFLTAGFYEQLRNKIEELNIPPEHIELELTEQNLFKNSKYIEREFVKLDWLGVKLSIDDFGTGYNSFEYVRRFKFDSLKLDKSFIQSMFENNIDMAIIESMTRFAKSLGINVIAEGVESQEQLAYLAQLDVDEIQGYLKGKPMTSSHFEEKFLLNQNSIQHNVPLYVVNY